MNSLENICYENLYNQIINSPPLIQEMILQTTTKKIQNNISNELLCLVPYIMDNIICSKVYNIEKQDFKSKCFGEYSEDVIDCAIRMSETIILLLEIYYREKEFKSCIKTV